jgi:copper chaperone CopZ
MNSSKISPKSASAGLFAAVLASLCCITPVMSLLTGISGIAAAFSWMEPFRPYLIALTIGVLAFALYHKLKPRTAEEIACACEDDEKPSFWQSKKFLGIVTVFAVLMLTFPGYSHIFYPESKHISITPVNPVSNTTTTYNTIDLSVRGMTCTGCEAYVTNVVEQLEGVAEVKASYENGNVVIKYDPVEVDQDQIVETINETGYTIIEKPD